VTTSEDIPTSLSPALSVVQPDDARRPADPLQVDPPEAPIRGVLQLTGTQEQRLKELIKQRISRAKNSYIQGKWLDTRRLATAHYQGDFSNRKVPGSIFWHSNISLNLPKRYVRLTSARAFDELLSSDPFISVGPEGDEDPSDEAKALERLLAYKFNEGELRNAFAEAKRAALIRGEAVVKLNWVTRKRRYKRRVRLLLDAEDKPVMARDGNPVCDRDAFFPDPNKPGQEILAKDHRIILTGPPKWSAEQVVTFHKVILEGLEVGVVDYRDFLCDTTEKCVHAADFNAIRLDLPLDEVVAQLNPVKNTPQGRSFLRQVINQARPDGDSAQRSPDDIRGETLRPDVAIPLCKFAEVYLRAVVDPDGQSDEIAVLYDIENDLLFAYEYLSNISPTHMRPYRVVRTEPVENRWYGCGLYELFQDRHKFCDLFFNRVNFRSSMAGNLKFENPFATEEGMAGEPIEFGTDKTYRVREGYSPQDAFAIVTIPDDGAASQNLLNMLLQVTQLEAGMVSAGDHGLAGLPASELATGIKSLERVANAMLKVVFHDLIDGFETLLQDAAVLTLSRVSEYEVERLMGPEKAALIKPLRDVDSLRYRVRLVLSNAKDSDVLKSNQQAIDLVMNYITSVPPEFRPLVRPLFLMVLKTLGIKEADRALPEKAPDAPPTAAPLPDVPPETPPNEETEAQPAAA
jgi:hypothetical protein